MSEVQIGWMVSTAALVCRETNTDTKAASLEEIVQRSWGVVFRYYSMSVVSLSRVTGLLSDTGGNHGR